MKKFGVFIILFAAVSQTYSQQDTLFMKSLVRNVFDAKLKLEGAELLSDSASIATMSASTVETLFTERGITANVDSLNREYDLHVQRIKNRKSEFMMYFIKLTDTPGFPPSMIYNFKHPYSSRIDRGSIMSYYQCATLVQHFLIDLDRDRLPPFFEATRYLEKTNITRPKFHVNAAL